MLRNEYKYVINYYFFRITVFQFTMPKLLYFYSIPVTTTVRLNLGKFYYNKPTKVQTTWHLFFRECLFPSITRQGNNWRWCQFAILLVEVPRSIYKRLNVHQSKGVHKYSNEVSIFLCWTRHCSGVVVCSGAVFYRVHCLIF